jgi:hypothetical protein
MAHSTDLLNEYRSIQDIASQVIRLSDSNREADSDARRDWLDQPSEDLCFHQWMLKPRQ